MTDRPAIRALDDDTIRQIAAGEVVERPASVVKELVENSLDADASRVSVGVENGGIDGIRVTDDGIGMDAESLERAVEQHTTSKIRDITDLDAGVGTLGFRGEALHTIGAVSRMTVRSKPRGGGEVGHELEFDGGETGTVEPTGCPEGTTVAVEDLFFNTPARKKFLKTPATEFDHVNTVVTQYALANPDVAVSLEHNGRTVFGTEGNGDLRAAVLAVYGRDVAESMIEIETSFDDDAPLDRVHGLVSHPETTRSSREYLATFVNDRYVTASILRQAVVDAYGGQLAPDRYPFAVLFLEVDPATVDVNVHPRKMEIRFDEEAAVKEIVRDAVSTALVDHGLIRSSAPRGRSAPDEVDTRPETVADRTAEPSEADGDAAEGPVIDGSARDGSGSDDNGPRDNPEDWIVTDAQGGGQETSSDPVSPTSDIGPSIEDGDGSRGPEDGGSTVTGADGSVDTGDDPDDGSQSGGDRTSSDSDSATTGGGDQVGFDPAGFDHSGVDHAGVDHSGPSPDPDRPSPRSWQEAFEPDTTEADDETETSRSQGGGFRDPTSQRTLSGSATTRERAFESLPNLRILGQLFETYLVAEARDGLVLIDQHAADERINYERLQRTFAGGMTAQALADPVELELTAREAALFDEYTDALERLGFHAERVDDRVVAVDGVPTVFDATLDPSLLQDVITAFVREGHEAEREIGDVADDLLADLACYPSVTGNTALTEGSVVDLLEALDACENPYACPHGRPVIIAFDREDLADRFERDYPGHTGRRAE